jgi:iron complex transport system ATP-binding protein
MTATGIDGVAVEIGAEAVVVTAAAPLAVVSSAVVGGGLGRARTVVNVHVPKDFPYGDADGEVHRFVSRRGLPSPYVGLLTSAWTERATLVRASAHGVAVLAAVTVGLSNRIAAGFAEAAGAAAPSTINAIVVVDAAPEPAALVNALMTVTEVKTAALIAAAVACDDGRPATGTSTDAVVVAATGRGRACRFGGPISELGAVVARAAQAAFDAGIARWLEEHR